MQPFPLFGELCAADEKGWLENKMDSMTELFHPLCAGLKWNILALCKTAQ